MEGILLINIGKAAKDLIIFSAVVVLFTKFAEKTSPLIAKEKEDKIMRITNLFKTEKKLYGIRLTQEGALKFASVLNQMIPSGDLGIVQTITNPVRDEIWAKDVIIHAKLTPRKFEVIKELVDDYLVNYEIIGEESNAGAVVWK